MISSMNDTSNLGVDAERRGFGQEVKNYPVHSGSGRHATWQHAGATASRGRGRGKAGLYALSRQ
jgi:hypothetical protein